MHRGYFQTLFIILTLFHHLIETSESSSEPGMYWEKLFDSLSYKLSSKPAPRRDTAIGHDIDRNRIIVFGGRQSINPDVQSILIPVIFDDTWEFNLETSRTFFLQIK